MKVVHRRICFFGFFSLFQSLECDMYFFHLCQSISLRCFLFALIYCFNFWWRWCSRMKWKSYCIIVVTNIQKNPKENKYILRLQINSVPWLWCLVTRGHNRIFSCLNMVLKRGPQAWKNIMIGGGLNLKHHLWKQWLPTRSVWDTTFLLHSNWKKCNWGDRNDLFSLRRRCGDI